MTNAHAATLDEEPKAASAIVKSKLGIAMEFVAMSHKRKMARSASRRYLTGTTIGWPFSATRKSIASARSVVLGFLIR